MQATPTDGKLTFRHSLKLRFLIIVIGFVTVLSVVYTAYAIYQFRTLAIHTVYHEGLLLSDALTSGIKDAASHSDILSIQRFIDRLVETRKTNDIEINVIRRISDVKSTIVASNNPGNIEDTDEEEHAGLLASLRQKQPHMLIEKNVFDVDPDDDLSTHADPNHPDYYFQPGYRTISITTPIFVDGMGWGSTNIELSLSHLDRELEQIYRYVGIALGVGLVLLAGTLIIFLNKKLFNPLWNLANGIYHFGVGKLKEPDLDWHRNDEIGVLNHEFNNMVLRITDAEAMNRQYRDHLEELVAERTSELALTQEATILCMASLAETRDPETGGHIKRTQSYILVLAERLKRYPKYAAALDDETIDLIVKSAPLHDIGKVGIPDDILLKPGKLTAREFEIIKLHTVYGRDAIYAAEAKLGSNSFLRYAREIAYTHQEKWDGSGYPQGLKGEEIPVSGRLMAIADVYDALISRRVYKPPFPHEMAMSIIRKERGKHFDPDMVDAFCSLEQKIRTIASELADSDEERDNLTQMSA